MRERDWAPASLANVIGELPGGSFPARRRFSALRCGRTPSCSSRSSGACSTGRPVAAVGMLAVQRLLTSPESGLYAAVADVEARPADRAHQVGGALMYDLAALAMAAVCLAFCFLLLYVLEKI